MHGNSLYNLSLTQKKEYREQSHFDSINNPIRTDLQLACNPGGRSKHIKASFAFANGTRLEYHIFSCHWKLMKSQSRFIEFQLNASNQYFHHNIRPPVHSFITEKCKFTRTDVFRGGNCHCKEKSSQSYNRMKSRADGTEGFEDSLCTKHSTNKGYWGYLFIILNCEKVPQI